MNTTWRFSHSVESHQDGSREFSSMLDRRTFLAASLAMGAFACQQASKQPPTDSGGSTLSDALSRDALGQAELVRNKEVKPIELVEAVIERIEKLNPQLNAVVTKMYDHARELAQGDLPEGPLTGVPFLLKDLGPAYAGVRQTAGSRALEHFVSDHDSELVLRHKRAGLIIVGKTNTPEFGLTATTEPHLFGPTRNPWALDRTTGGSSGGSAAAVAARILPVAHANDGGGSIRIPASCCGVFGLKPTRARNPLGPDFGDRLSGLAVDHAVTLTVRDSAALLDATSGPDIGDPYYAPPKQRPFLEEVGEDPGRLRVAFSAKAPAGTPVHADCVAAVENTAELLESLGHEVEEAAPEVDGELFIKSFMTLWFSGTASTIEAIARAKGRAPDQAEYEPLTWQLFQKGTKITGATYLHAVGYLQRMSRQIAHFLRRYDVWLTPTIAEPPPPLGTLHPKPDDTSPDSDRILERILAFVPFTPLANATGQPAMSVPLHWNNDGLPVGVHFFGRFGDEATLFRLAAQLEEVQPWIDRVPVVSAARAG